jgi:hypothetical protein
MTGPNPNKQAVELNRTSLYYSQVTFSININLVGVFYGKHR